MSTGFADRSGVPCGTRPTRRHGSILYPVGSEVISMRVSQRNWKGHSLHNRSSGQICGQGWGFRAGAESLDAPEFERESTEADVGARSRPRPGSVPRAASAHFSRDFRPGLGRRAPARPGAREPRKIGHRPHRHLQHPGPGRAAPAERHETLVPVRQNALEARFHRVRCAGQPGKPWTRARRLLVFVYQGSRPRAPTW